MVTIVPGGPDAGLNLFTVGLTLKLAGLQATPTGVVTEMGPVSAPFGTVAVILVSETTVKAAPTPLNRTTNAPVKARPVMLTDFPTLPDVGDVPVMAGNGWLGSYSSAEDRYWEPSDPPATRTSPSGRAVAVWPARAVAIVPAGDH